MRLNGAEILMECLLEQGVDVIFGYPGGAVLNIYDALYKYQNRITHYLTSHEQHAAHAADGYARATGKVGVCLATSGPGATNLVTGIATAYMDSIPMVAITGNVLSSLLGKDSFQEVDIAGIVMPVTKHSFIVRDAAELAGTVRRAFEIARTGRPGPVLIDITKDATAQLGEYVREEPKEALVRPISTRELDAAAAMINAAEKPLIYGGGGIIASGAAAVFRAFAERLNAPVCLSSMGLGGFPSSHEQFTGMIGMHGTKASNMAATECDLLIACGARFSDRVISDVTKFAPKAKILHIDIDPAEMGKNVVIAQSVTGDMKAVLDALTPLCAADAQPTARQAWLDEVLAIKAAHPPAYKKDGVLRPQYILERISALTKGEAIVATEVGQHQMWSCHFVDYERPRSFVSSGGLGTMGYGLGAAIGAKVGCPERVVFNIAGDGCFRMNHIEMATAVEYNIPIVVVIMNNRALGMVRQWQTMFYDKRYSQTTLDRTTDFVKLAEAYQCAAFHVTKPEEVDEALKQAMACGGPAVVHCEIDRDEKVFPMVAPGAGIDEIVEA